MAIIVFFFFQAEDGIRDYKVTEVQTCALPIWKYDTEEELIWDAVAYQLQYLNHAINFFLYVLANNSFRYEEE